MSGKHGSSSTRSHPRPASSSRALRENEVSRGGFLDFLLPNYYSDDEDSYYDDDDYTYGSMSYTCDDDTASVCSRRSSDRRARSDTIETLDTVNHRLEELDSTIDTSAVADAETVIADAETVIDTIASGDDANTHRDDSDDESNGGCENSWKMFLGGDESTPLFSRMVNHLLPNIEDLPQQTKQETTRNEKTLTQTKNRDNTTMTHVQPNTPETRTETQERRSSSHNQDHSNIVTEENAVDDNIKIVENTGNVKPAEKNKNTPTEATGLDVVMLPSKVVEFTQKAKPLSKGRFAKLRSSRASKKKALAAAATAAEEAAREVEAEIRRAERRERRRSQMVRITVTNE